MTDLLNLKINEHSNVEQPNLQVTTIENFKGRNLFISKGKYENWRNCDYCGIKNSENLLISQFRKFQKFPKFYNSKNVLKFIFRKSSTSHY